MKFFKQRMAKTIVWIRVWSYRLILEYCLFWIRIFMPLYNFIILIKRVHNISPQNSILYARVGGFNDYGHFFYSIFFKCAPRKILIIWLGALKLVGTTKNVENFTFLTDRWKLMNHLFSFFTCSVHLFRTSKMEHWTTHVSWS